MSLITSPFCSNSPKKELIKNLTVYFALYDLEKAMEFMDEQISWTLVGDETIVGKERFRAELEKMSHNKAVELSIRDIVTHGKSAAVHGEMLMQDGSRFGFSDFYEFTGAKGTCVKSIVSYVIEIKSMESQKHTQ